MTKTIIRQSLREAHLDDYSVPSDGTTDGHASFQTLLDNMDAAGGGTITGRLGGAYLVNTTLEWPNGVHFNGAGVRPGTSADSAWIKGTAGVDTILLSNVAANQNGMSFKNARISGGSVAFKSERLAYDVTMENLELAGTTASILIEGSLERWSLRDVLMTGGTYGFQMAYGTVVGLNYMDKCVFDHVRATAQTKNAWRIEGVTSSTCVWNNPVWDTISEHGFYADITAVGWTFIQANTEAIGTSGLTNKTTGTITSGTASLVVASATGLAIGQTLTVEGAGANGTDLSSVIDGIAGTTITLHDNASTSVTALRVTNAVWDDVHFTNILAGTGPNDVQFIGGVMGVEGVSGKLRYGVRSATGRVIFMGAVVSRPVYDPLFLTTIWGGNVAVRQPSGVSALNPLYPTLPIGGSREANRGIISSPGGKPLTIFLNDSNLAGTGTRDKLEVRAFDSTRRRLFYIDDATSDVVQERSTGHLTANGILRINPKANPATCSVGDMNIHTDNKLYYCSAADTWTLV